MVNVAIIPSMVNGWALSTPAIPIDVFLLVFSKPRSMGVQCGVRLDTTNNNIITGSQASQKKTTMTSFFASAPSLSVAGVGQCNFFGRVISGSDVAVINTITADGDHEQTD